MLATAKATMDQHLSMSCAMTTESDASLSEDQDELSEWPVPGDFWIPNMGKDPSQHETPVAIRHIAIQCNESDPNTSIQVHRRGPKRKQVDPDVPAPDTCSISRKEMDQFTRDVKRARLRDVLVAATVGSLTGLASFVGSMVVDQLL